jgi:hypothetical protein
LLPADLSLHLLGEESHWDFSFGLVDSCKAIRGRRKITDFEVVKCLLVHLPVCRGTAAGGHGLHAE